MDSYKFYTEKCVMSFDRVENCRGLLKYIYDELFTPPYELRNSPFIAEVMRMTEEGTAEAIALCDAYIVMLALQGCIASDEGGISYVLERYAHYLFNDSRFPQKTLETYTEQTKRLLAETDKAVSEKRKLYEEKEAKRKAEEALRQEAIALMIKENSEIDAEIEAELTQRYRMHMDYNKEAAEGWHSEQEKINRVLAMMQPDIRKLLEGFMSFSTTVTEQYVFKYAKLLIELYNQIADGYDYHSAVSEMSGNHNYKNAVASYEEYLYTIADSLAVFGVEEIKSKSGMPFDGRIHSARGMFSPREARVVKSVRSGFKYNDTVLQKEIVTVE